MIKGPRIELDASKLLGFKQMKRVLPGNLTGQQAKVGVAPPTPEPSAYVQLLLGFLVLGFFILRSHYQKKKTQPGAITDSPAVAGATGTTSRKD